MITRLTLTEAPLVTDFQVSYTWPAISQGFAAVVSVSVPGSPVGPTWTVFVNGVTVGSAYGSGTCSDIFLQSGDVLSLTGYPAGGASGQTNVGPAVMSGFQGLSTEVSPTSTTSSGSNVTITPVETGITTTNNQAVEFQRSQACTGLLVTGGAEPEAGGCFVTLGGENFDLYFTLVQICPPGSGLTGLWYMPCPPPFVINSANPNTFFQFATAGTAYGIWEIDGPFNPSAGGGGTTNATELQGVGISTTAPTNNQVLTYESGTGLWTPETPSGGGAMTLIASQVLSSAQASVSFSSIPATYNHLRLVIMGASSDAAASDIGKVQLNADTGGNYDYQVAYGYNSNAWEIVTGTTTGALLYSVPGTSVQAGTACLFEVDIPCYAATTFRKIINSIGGYNAAQTSVDDASQGTSLTTWRNTAAVTEVTALLDSGSNWVVGSSFYLYGIT